MYKKDDEGMTRTRLASRSVDWKGNIGPFCRVDLPPALRNRMGVSAKQAKEEDDLLLKETTK